MEKNKGPNRKACLEPASAAPARRLVHTPYSKEFLSVYTADFPFCPDLCLYRYARMD